MHLAGDLRISFGKGVCALAYVRKPVANFILICASGASERNASEKRHKGHPVNLCRDEDTMVRKLLLADSTRVRCDLCGGLAHVYLALTESSEYCS